MSKLICIGELLIDFIPEQKGVKLKDVSSFERVAGGAPANVAACVSKLGEQSILLSQVGQDAFGDYLINTLREVGVEVKHIKQTTEANTALAFVSLEENGERDFSFYRHPSADMLLEPSDIPETIFQPQDVLHFCSVDLVDYPVKKAHIKALEYAHEHDTIVSFDPNLRFPLWPNRNEYRNTILEFIPQAHIIKVSDDELHFITKKQDINEAVQSLFIGHVKLVILTRGSHGATIYSKNHSVEVASKKTTAVDTTGAGDSFIGAIIYQIIHQKMSITTLENLIDPDILTFAHTVSRIVVEQKGAIVSMPTIEQVLYELL